MTDVDALAEVRAQIKALQEREALLRDRVLAYASDGQLDGEAYRAKVVRSSCSRVDYKAICERLRPSRQLVVAHTTKQERVSIRLSARPNPLVQVYPAAG